MTVSGAGRDRKLSFRTNVDDIVKAGGDNPLRIAVDQATGEPSPYILVRDRLEALIVRAVYYDLVELGTDERIDGEDKYGVWSGGAFFPLGAAGMAED